MNSEKTARLLTGNLDAGQAALCREEGERLAADDRAAREALAGWQVQLHDLSAPGQPPAGLRPESLAISAAGPHRPAAFAARAAWERDRQSYQVIPAGPGRCTIVGGGPEGVVYGFYAFLARTTGVRWPGVAATDRVFTTPADNPAVTGRPAVPLRGFEFALRRYDQRFVLAFLDWMGRNGWNLLNLNAADWAACPWRDRVAAEAARRGIRLAAGGHAVDLFLPASTFDRHPEFFGLREGRRCREAMVFSPDVRGGITRPKPIQPCYGSPATRAHLAAAITDFLAEHPEIDIFSLWPHDGTNNWCHCPACRASTPWELLYALALEITARQETVPVEVLCYANSLNPPRQQPPASDRTYTLFCPYLRQHRHPLHAPGFPADQMTLGRRYPEPEPINPADDREYGLLLEQWRPHLEACGSALGIFAYYQLVFHDETGRSDRSRFMYHPDPGLIAAELRYFLSRGMTVFQDCSPPCPGFWPDGRFHACLGQLLWDPARDEKALARDYYQATLGDQGETVRATLETIAAALEDRDRPALTGAILAEARATLEKVSGDRGTRYRLWLDYLALGEKARRAFLAGDNTAAGRAEEAIEAFFEENRAALAGHLNVDWMSRHTRTARAYLAARSTTAGGGPAAG